MGLRRWGFIILILLFPFQLGVVGFQQPYSTIDTPQISNELQQQLDNASSTDFIPVIVRLKPTANLENLPTSSRSARLEALILRLQSTARSSQQPFRVWLYEKQQAGSTNSPTFFWSINAFAIQATPEVIKQLTLFPSVLSISLDSIYDAPVSITNPPSIEPNLTQINVQAIWAQGWDGFGVVVASLDTGVDATHPDLAPRWRGGTNSWFDPYNQHSTPYDPSGHGTGVMGIMVGGSAGGTSIGIAPGARWISAKIFNDSGKATTSAIHAAFQWILDPDNNPATPDAPNILNNSWGGIVPGCNLEFQPDLQVLVAAGVLPIFAAGNLGPTISSNASPANLPEAFSVGSVDSADLVAPFSSRGPSNCSPNSIYPNLVAPGVNINSTERSGLYGSFSGTSVAAPHAVGVLALMLQAYPFLTIEQQRQALLAATIDLPSTPADNDTGIGRLDACIGFQWLQENIGQTAQLPVKIHLPFIQN